MLRVIQAGTGRAVSYLGSPSDVFEPGMIAQFKQIGNDVVVGVSDGIGPVGILDDIRTNAFSQPVIDEIVIIEAPTSFDGYNWITTTAASKELQNANIVPQTFRADVAGLTLLEKNGVLRAPVGTTANYQTDESATPNAIRTRVRYSFYVPNIPGEDSTLGSGKITFWFTRGIFQTDQYEMVPFAVNATLFVSSKGKLTTEQTSSNQPGVAMCLIPPTAHNQMLEFLWM